jgi:hypothetical protein
MGITTSTTVSVHLLTEALGPAALEPLRGKRIMPSLVNFKDISGLGTKVRKISKHAAIADAVNDTEASSAPAPSSLSMSSISCTPTTRVASVEVTTDALELYAPGMTRESVLGAIASNNVASMPLIRHIMNQILEAHMGTLETELFALFSGLSESSGTGNPALSFDILLDSLSKIMDNNIASENLAYVIDENGMKDLRALAAGGTGAALSTIFSGNATDMSWFNHRPDVLKTGVRGAFAGIPLIAGDKAKMVTATNDRVGALIVVGSGAVDAPGAVRGFAELVARYAPSLEFVRDPLTDTLTAIGRSCWGSVEHTDEHGVKLIYDLD